MSFAADVKAELCRAKLGKKCCTQAEACGVLLYCNRFSLREVKIVTESPAFAQRLPGLFHRAFGLSFDEKGDPDAPGKWRCCGSSAPLTPPVPPTTSILERWKRNTAAWHFCAGRFWPAGL